MRRMIPCPECGASVDTETFVCVQNHKLVGAMEASKKIGISNVTLRRHVASNRIVHYGRWILVAPSEVVRLTEEFTRKPRSPRRHKGQLYPKTLVLKLDIDTYEDVFRRAVKQKVSLAQYLREVIEFGLEDMNELEAPKTKATQPRGMSNMRSAY